MGFLKSLFWLGYYAQVKKFLSCLPWLVYAFGRVRIKWSEILPVVVVYLLSCLRLLRPLWTVAHQALLSKGFSRQEYWSGLLSPPQGDSPHPAIESTSFISPALAGRFFTTNWDLSSQSYGFSISHECMWELEYKESWVPKNWCWTVVLERLFRVPWTARRPNQSILKEISPEYSLEGLMLKLKIQYFGHWCKELTHLKRPW